MRKYSGQDLFRAVPARVRLVCGGPYLPNGKDGVWAAIRGWPGYGTLRAGNEFNSRGFRWRLGWQTSKVGTIRVAKIIHV